ncbi:acetyl-CoA carboxylase biotin carboxyl carrier protein subunit [Phenylobacterium sp.]|jgi:biotin carboxyl carrier protein|uniref:acetyl-CoA carboxylase biotin carboxyl carrier protein subunit n=1 Tax=Phenylobacterium sp. TaxID=1871053 RepID=UPI002F92C5E3
MAELTVRAEFAGIVLSVSVEAGRVVEADQELLVIESMKTEIPVGSPKAGRVTGIRVSEGQTVEERQPLVVLET